MSKATRAKKLEHPHPSCETFKELLSFLGRKHVLELLYVLGEKSPMRFNELQAVLGVTPKSLTTRLGEFEKNGLVTRKAYNEIPPRVEYTLTPKGRALVPAFKTLAKWNDSFGTGPSVLVVAHDEEASMPVKR